ncbi:hypothetical protein B0T17DRAFT_481857 [Bombardia bombarda]|uniref:Uncharacterized protein n=1 Tax=Bombardia bombarda TaxID=252184 RepID=A0AA40CFF7_9PEZI|nr:hypothetical protein B0T17DRAFT_481857 [Bombardia bombarda]
MKPSITITEPHPTVPKNSYTHSGRGGAGNFFRAPATTAPTGIPTKTAAAPTTTTARFYSGRGGAGNAHAAVERPLLSFDEEFNRAEVREKAATLSHVGRGGAGNIFSSTHDIKKDRKQSTSSRRDSSSTSGSVRSGFWNHLGHVVSN